MVARISSICEIPDNHVKLGDLVGEGNGYGKYVVPMAHEIHH
jgi:hypothetical protein